MPLYDYRCPSCHAECELFALMDFRNDQTCAACGVRLELVLKPTPRYVPFQPYFDEGLGVAVTGQDHRRRVMRDLHCDHRDPPSKGDQSARCDRCEAIRKNRLRQ